MPERTIRRLRKQRFVLLAVLMAVAVLIAGGALLYAISSNKDSIGDNRNDIVTVEAQTEVVCTQVLKLRKALVENVDAFEAAVEAGYKRRAPGEEATAQERATAHKFFNAQRMVLQDVICP